jgi:calcineurin-like phosphoesterase family protein
MVEGQYVVACHYAMRVWPRSHYNSYLCYGHSHGQLAPQGKQWDVGVDNNDFYPVSFQKLKVIMENQPDNFNLVRK